MSSRFIDVYDFELPLIVQKLIPSMSVVETDQETGKFMAGICQNGNNIEWLEKLFNTEEEAYYNLILKILGDENSIRFVTLKNQLKNRIEKQFSQNEFSVSENEQGEYAVLFKGNPVYKDHDPQNEYKEEYEAWLELYIVAILNKNKKDKFNGGN